MVSVLYLSFIKIEENWLRLIIQQAACLLCHVHQLSHLVEAKSNGTIRGGALKPAIHAIRTCRTHPLKLGMLPFEPVRLALADDHGFGQIVLFTALATQRRGAQFRTDHAASSEILHLKMFIGYLLSVVRIHADRGIVDPLEHVHADQCQATIERWKDLLLDIVHGVEFERRFELQDVVQCPDTIDQISIGQLRMATDEIRHAFTLIRLSQGIALRALQGNTQCGNGRRRMILVLSTVFLRENKIQQVHLIG